MASITIYHNPRCSKSRQALALLEEHGVEPTVRRYLDEPLSAAELKALLKKLGVGARKLLRTSEAEYKELGLADSGLGDAELVAAIAAHPKLMQRPVVEKGATAVIGRPPENVLELLGR